MHHGPCRQWLPGRAWPAEVSDDRGSESERARERARERERREKESKRKRKGDGNRDWTVRSLVRGERAGWWGADRQRERGRRGEAQYGSTSDDTELSTAVKGCHRQSGVSTGARSMQRAKSTCF